MFELAFVLVFSISVSACAKDSHSVAAEVHNAFLENMVSTEVTLTKVLSMARVIFEMQLCISIADNNSYTSGWRKVDCKFLTAFSTRGGRRHWKLGKSTFFVLPHKIQRGDAYIYVYFLLCKTFVHMSIRPALA